jgi:hypothetical protein
MKNKFPFEHAIKYDTKEVWIKCDSVTTAIRLPTLVNQYYPGYTAKIGTVEQLDRLRNQLVN